MNYLQNNPIATLFGLVLLSFLIVGGCSPAPFPEPGVNNYEIVVSKSDSVPAGGKLENITVQVRNGIGRLLDTVRLEYKVIAGDGTLNKVVENIGKRQTSFNWTLGYKLGSHKVEIRAFDSLDGSHEILGSPFIYEVSTMQIKDVDGHVYNTTEIDGRVWTVENLKTTKFKEGSSILSVSDSASWNKAYYDNLAAYTVLNDDLFGKMYNVHAIYNAKGICPKGWHVPTAAEWKSLISYAGGESFAGGHLRSVDTWPNSNGASDNQYIMSVKNGGFVDSDGEILNIDQTVLWGLNPAGMDFDNSPFFIDDESMFFASGEGLLGFYCRCVKD